MVKSRRHLNSSKKACWLSVGYFDRQDMWLPERIPIGISQGSDPIPSGSLKTGNFALKHIVDPTSYNPEELRSSTQSLGCILPRQQVLGTRAKASSSAT